MELVLELVARSTGTGAGGVAALDHEAVDDAVEDCAVVERSGLGTRRVLRRVLLGSVREADEVRDGLGGVIAEQFDDDIAAVGVQRGRLGLVW